MWGRGRAGWATWRSADEGVGGRRDRVPTSGRRGARGGYGGWRRPSPRSRAPRSRRRLEASAWGVEETRGFAYCSFPFSAEIRVRRRRSRGLMCRGRPAAERACPRGPRGLMTVAGGARGAARLILAIGNNCSRSATTARCSATTARGLLHYVLTCDASQPVRRGAGVVHAVIALRNTSIASALGDPPRPPRLPWTGALRLLRT